MKTILHLKDDQYPFTYIDQIREISRAVVFNDKGEIALTKLLADDKFGHRDYYELPGGGVQVGETFEQAALREIEEEIGFSGEIVAEIGQVIDVYNLIHRENHNHYFLIKAHEFVGTRMEEKEKHLIEKIVWVEIDEAKHLFLAMNDFMLSGLVKRRESPILDLAGELLKKLKR